MSDIKKSDAYWIIKPIFDEKGYQRGYEVIKRIPSAEVESVEHGHWIEGPMCIECSCCGEIFSDEIAYMCDPYRKPKRCPECGAHMDEEVNDGQDDSDR